MTPNTADTLRQELRTLVTPGRRMADEIECVASVMLAIVLAHLIGARMIGPPMIAWAAFSAFVLMKGPVTETLLRGVLRMIGTFLGATLAIWFERLSSGAPWQVMLVVAAVGGVSLYGTLTRRRSYAWLLFGLTFLMIVLDRLEEPGIDIEALALTRVLEVGAGTLACVIVSVVSTLTTRRLWPVSRTPAAPSFRWHPDAARHAGQAAVALALLPLAYHRFHIPELAQAGVTVMAVMIVPVAGIGAGSLGPVSRRLRHRALGCLAGGLLATAILFAAHGSAPLLITGTCLGIVIGRHIENGGARNAYVGLQFTLAVLVVLVPDDYSRAAIGPGLERLISVFVGMGVLVPILLAWHALSPRSEQDGPAEEAAASE